MLLAPLVVLDAAERFPGAKEDYRNMGEHKVRCGGKDEAAAGLEVRCYRKQVWSTCRTLMRCKKVWTSTMDGTLTIHTSQ